MIRVDCRHPCCKHVTKKKLVGVAQYVVDTKMPAVNQVLEFEAIVIAVVVMQVTPDETSITTREI